MDPLLEPISEESPCGVDLSYDPVYNDLAVLIEGTPENQYEPGSAKEPNWGSIRKLSEDALKRSKDLQLGVYFTTSLMQTTGIAGALRGVELMAGMVRTYWQGLFPALDPDDPDPTQRVNILSQLTVEPSSYGDPIKFIDRLNEVPIFRVPGMAVSIGFLTRETTPGAGTGAAKLPELMANGNAEETAAGIGALRQLAAAVHSIDDFLIEKLGREGAPSFDLLIKALDKGLRVFDALTPGASSEAAAPTDGAPATGVAGPAAASQGIAGEIRSLDDVRRTLKKIRDFYVVNEPASPVPFLLQRAENLIGKNFLDLLENLTPSAKSDFETLMGPQAEEK